MLCTCISSHRWTTKRDGRIVDCFEAVGTTALPHCLSLPTKFRGGGTDRSKSPVTLRLSMAGKLHMDSTMMLISAVRVLLAPALIAMLEAITIYKVPMVGWY